MSQEDDALAGLDVEEAEVLDRQPRAEQSASHDGPSLCQLMVEHNPLGIALFASDGHLRQCNRSFANFFWTETSALVGRHFTSLCHPDELPAAERNFQALLSGQVPDMSVRARYLGPDDGTLWVNVSARATPDQQVVLVLEEVTSHQAREEMLRYQAYHDELTGLANRRSFITRLNDHVTRVARYGGNGALFFIDVDNLKGVNDNLGHMGGDALIQEIGQRLENRLRASDLLGRIGGDEFAVLLPLAGQHEGELVGGMLLDKLGKEPFLFEGREIPISVSIGIAILDSPMRTEELIEHADQAMYQAKQAGGNRCQIYQGPSRRKPKPGQEPQPGL